MNTRQRISDEQGADVLHTSGSPGVFPSDGHTTAVDVRGFSGVEWTVYLPTVGSISSIAFRIQYSTKQSPGAETPGDWVDVRTDNIAAGLSPLTTYVPSETVSGSPLTISSPVRGRWMRLRVVPTGDPAGSSGYITAYRRS